MAGTFDSNLQLQRRLAAIVETTRDAIYSYDTSGRITSWNPAAERIFGYRGLDLPRPDGRLGPPEHTLETDRLAQLLARCAGRAPDALLEELERLAAEHRGDGRQRDDVAPLALRRT